MHKSRPIPIIYFSLLFLPSFIPSRSKRQRIPLIRQSVQLSTPGQDRNSFPMIPRIYPGLNRGSPKALSFQPYIRSTMFDASNSPVGTWKSAYRGWFHDHSVSTQRFTQFLSIYPQIITLCQRRSNGWTARRKRNDSSAIVFHLIAFVFTFRCCVYAFGAREACTFEDRY